MKRRKETQRTLVGKGKEGHWECEGMKRIGKEQLQNMNSIYIYKQKWLELFCD